jgi:hypothetical protein
MIRNRIRSGKTERAWEKLGNEKGIAVTSAARTVVV